MGYEYSVQKFEQPEELQTHLNKMGHQGFKLVSLLTQNVQSYSGYCVIATMQRRSFE